MSLEVDALKIEISNYLEKNPNLTLNGLSSRCGISEPTLRRIMKGGLKKGPKAETLFEILSYIYREKSFENILERAPSSLKKVLSDYCGHIKELKNTTLSERLNQILKDEQCYIIFKLASFEGGVKLEYITYLFGMFADQKLQILFDQDFVYEENGNLYTKIKNYTLSNDYLKRNMKLMIDFLTVDPYQRKNKMLAYNFSDSLNEEGYQKMLDAVDSCVKEVIAIKNDPGLKGHIPAFCVLGADSMTTFEKNSTNFH